MAKQDLILIALNSSPVLGLMERALSAAGYNVSVVHDHPRLEKAIQEAIPALLLIGEKFSDQDGFSFAREILNRFPTLPVILYADKYSIELASSVLKTGLSGYLHSPLNISDIVDEVQRSLVRARKLGDWLRREVKRTNILCRTISRGDINGSETGAVQNADFRPEDPKRIAHERP